MSSSSTSASSCARGVERRPAAPSVRLADIGMGAEADELLPVGENLDLVCCAVGRLEAGRHFCEWRRGAEHQCALGRAAEAHRDHAAIAEQFLTHLLGEGGGLGVGDVDVDRGRVRREQPVLVPDHVLISAALALVLCCHPGIEGRLPMHGIGRIAVCLHGEANIGGGHCGFPPGRREAASGCALTAPEPSH